MTAPRKPPTAELQQILAQVEAELQRMQEAHESGEICIFVGGHTIQVESRTKRKLPPVRVRISGMTRLTRTR